MLPDVFSRRTAFGRFPLLALLIGLAGCASPVPMPEPAAPALTAAQISHPSPTEPSPAAQLSAAVLTAAHPGTGSAGAPNKASDPAAARESHALADLLVYADRLRTLGPAELGAEIAALGEPGSQPLGQMQLGLALAHTHQPADTARALGLFQRVAGMDELSAGAYKALARLLATRLLDQRRLEDALERQTQQVREQQRRIEQLTDRLEAMRAIERSLNRPGNPSGNRSRPAPAP